MGLFWYRAEDRGAYEGTGEHAESDDEMDTGLEHSGGGLEEYDEEDEGFRAVDVDRLLDRWRRGRDE